MAFAPDYDESGAFYTYHSDYGTNGNLRITRYEVSADDPNVADPDSGMLVLEIANDPNINHNGGNLEFGPDGYLYWSTGDGGAAGDPYGNGQNIRTLYGILGRIDVSESTPLDPYAIPEDNPFALSSRISTGDPADFHPGAMPEIWAYGLRNPWEFSFDGESGDLYIADVGQNAWEEIDFAAAGTPGGQNYGWDWLEGSHCYPASMETCPRQQVGVLPVAEYPHTDGDCSITGLGVHRGEGSAALAGTYFAADYCSGRVWGLARDDSDAWVLEELLDTTLLVAGGGTSAAGDVYLTACSCSFGRDYDPLADPGGSVWQVVSADAVPSDATTAPLEPAAEEEPVETAGPEGEAEESASPEDDAEETAGTEDEG